MECDLTKHQLSDVNMWNLGQVQILWVQDLPLPFPFRERSTHCKTQGRWEFSSQSFNYGMLVTAFSPVLLLIVTSVVIHRVCWLVGSVVH